MNNGNRRVAMRLVSTLLIAAAMSQSATTAQAKESVLPTPANPGSAVTAWGSNAKGESEVLVNDEYGYQGTTSVPVYLKR